MHACLRAYPFPARVAICSRREGETESEPGRVRRQKEGEADQYLVADLRLRCPSLPISASSSSSSSISTSSSVPSPMASSICRVPAGNIITANLPRKISTGSRPGRRERGWKWARENGAGVDGKWGRGGAQGRINLRCLFVGGVQMKACLQVSAGCLRFLKALQCHRSSVICAHVSRVDFEREAAA